MGVSKTGGGGGVSHSQNNSGASTKSGSKNVSKSTPKTSYTVKPGDTLSQISQKLGKSVSGLMANNPQIKNADKIRVGDKINISGINADKTHTVATGENLSKIAKKYNTTVGNLLRANPNIANPRNLIYPGQNLNLPGAGKTVNTPVLVDGVKPTKATKGITTQLPPKGVGYVTYYSQADKFGTAKTIDRIKNIAAEWNKRHPNLPVPIGDISKKNGAPYLNGEHASHRKGVDFDMRPFRFDGSGGKVTVKDKNYNAKATREFVKMVKDMYPKTLIGFNDPVLNKSGLTQNWKKHDNHLHIRFLD